MISPSLPKEIEQEIEKINEPRVIVLWHSEPNKKPEIIKGESYVT